MSSSHLVFVESGGATRGFGDLKLGVCNLLASRVEIKGEELFEVRELVSLFWDLAFGLGDLFPGGSFGDMEDLGRSPKGGDEEESESNG